jgi:hypothetical protein
LSLLIGEDDILWPRLGLSGLFWMLLVAIGRIVWLRRRFRPRRPPLR